DRETPVHLFLPPGHLSDLDPEGQALWHAHMAALTKLEIDRLVSEVKANVPNADGRSVAYVDPTHVDLPVEATPAAQEWKGFPRRVLEYKAGNDHQRAWDIAETMQAEFDLYDK